MSKILNILKIAVIVLIAISYVVMTHEGLNNVYSSQNTTNNSIDVVNDSINDQIIFANMDTHKNLSYNLPNKPTYILRLDDMQSPAWSDISMKIINDALSRNMSISVAVIPNSDNLDPRGTIEFIREHKDNPRFEIVQHGFAHSRYEYANLSANETRSTTTRGLRKIYQDYNIYPVPSFLSLG